MRPTLASLRVLAAVALVGVAATGERARAEAGETPKRIVGVNAGLLMGGTGRFKTVDAFGDCGPLCGDGGPVSYTERARALVGLQTMFRVGPRFQLGYVVGVATAWQLRLGGGERVDLGARFDIGIAAEYVRPLGRTALVLGPQIGVGFAGRGGVTGLGLQLQVNAGFQTSLGALVVRTTVGYQLDVLLFADADSSTTLSEIGGRALFVVGFFFGS
ncbi:MAG: hypothetical protein H6744_00790 [Deltaproteobacteria bacterium]|nr:hypothetical protein [Deltaproteobacteria bacterium]MCB9785202.1 hypothetical protein [Deltaproteobacteria bacterium]